MLGGWLSVRYKLTSDMQRNLPVSHRMMNMGVLALIKDPLPYNQKSESLEMQTLQLARQILHCDLRRDQLCKRLD